MQYVLINKGHGCLHNLTLIPKERVGMKVCGGIEPKVQPLLPVTHSIHIHVGLHRVRFPCGVAQELKIELVVICTVRWHLRHKNWSPMSESFRYYNNWNRSRSIQHDSHCAIRPIKEKTRGAPINLIKSWFLDWKIKDRVDKCIY